MLFLYATIIVLLIILTIAAYIKIRFRFWAEQPVFHVYDVGYYLFYSGVIDQDHPKTNRYTNFKNVETLIFGKNVKDLDNTRFVQFINRHYLQNGENRFQPKRDNIIPYFEGHNSACFLSFYYKDTNLQDIKTNEIVTINKPVGIMTTRPVHITIRANRKKGTAINFDAYYVDYLCVDKAQRKIGIAPQIIQTHHYNQRSQNKTIVVSLFKREGVLTGIVPLCIYNMYAFSMRKWCKPNDLSPECSIIECGATNIYHLYDFLRTMGSEKMEISIIVEIANLIALIKTKNIYIYMLLKDATVKAAYFFRKSCTFIKGGEEAISCFASLNGMHKNENGNETFIHGFKLTISTICLKNPGFCYAVVEEISDNNLIIENLKKKTCPEFIIPAAYFFYNYAHATIPAKRTLVIN